MHFNVTLPTFVSNNLPISAALGLWCYCCLPHHIPLLCFIFCKIWFPAQLWYLGSKTFPWKPILQFTSLLWYVCHRISCNDAWRWSFTFWKDWFGSLDLLPFTYNTPYILKSFSLSLSPLLLPEIWQQVYQISTLKFFRTLITSETWVPSKKSY